MENVKRDKTCVVVADETRARFFVLQHGASPQDKNKLTERQLLTNDVQEAAARSRHSNRDAGPGLPYGAQRVRHRLEVDRRFAAEIVKRAGESVRGWNDGILVLVAQPRVLGLLRATLRGALARGIRLKALARDYTGASAAELQRRLESGNVLRP